ncbi:MAG TPA: DUF4159 domain-containing protein [Bryobacteraceae bacterium]|nr:DUF4159 domain-containing protein [Bryobacteraceae bacterium]
MSRRWGVALATGALLAALAFAGTEYVSQPVQPFQIDPTLPKAFRVYRSLEAYDNVDIPPDYREQTEFVFARLMYPSHPYGLFSRSRGYPEIADRDWRQGGVSWTQDYPRADRHFALVMRRLTRLHTRSAEQPVNPDDDYDIYNWPFLAAGEMGDWKLSGEQISKVREYLLRGGFLMLDDFWGPQEWARFMETMREIFPDRDVVDIDNSDPIFHIVYNLDDRYQILGQWALRGGMAERWVGTTPKWRGIYDDHHRLMVAITFNSDVGDSWEYADDQYYPEKYSALGIRWGVNDVIYSMTH